MAVVSLKYKSKQGTLTAPGDVDPGAMIPLITTTLSTTTASVTFSNIPAVYSHLQIRGIARTNAASTADYPQIRFNSDSGSNYAHHLLYGDGSAAGVAATTSTDIISASYITGVNSTASIFGAFVIDVLDYANTSKYKTMRALGGADQNGSGQLRYYSGLWMSTSAINSITITAFTGSFVQYSQFALYGIKRAGA